MAPPSKPQAISSLPPTTTSTCTVESAQGTHLFHIAAFSLHEILCAGTSVRSAPFSVGGYDWAVRFFPDGGDGGALALLLELLTKNPAAAVRASCAFRFLNPATGAASARWPVPLLHYRPGLLNKRAQVSTFRWNVLTYAHDDCVTVECAVTVVHEPEVSETKAVVPVQEPPSDLSAHLGSLLEEKDGSDVNLDVQGEVFTAHKIVLAMRSRVFKEIFYGPESEKNVDCVVVDDVRPSVFRILLHFIYTDSLSLPNVDDLGDEDRKEMFRHLLVAADQYEVKRLMLMCEDSLCKSLSTDSVATALAFAEENNLCNLKDACIEFITFPEKIHDVVASQGYKNLKRSCPSVLLEVLKRSSKLPRL